MQAKFAVLIRLVIARKGTTARLLTMPSRTVIVRAFCLNSTRIFLLTILNGTLSASPPSEMDPEEEYTGPPPISYPHVGRASKQRVDGKPKGARPTSISIPDATNFLPASKVGNSAPPTALPSAGSDKNRAKGSAASSASHRRTRSMSIPPTPGSLRLGTVSVNYLLLLVGKRCLNLLFQLFPAESPGGL
jgi:hypothetical protein